MLALVGLAAAGCGAEERVAAPAAPATLPASALPDLDSTVRNLDTLALAEDAFEPDELAALLEDAGYVAGREREFSGKTTTFDHVIARALVFADADGADAYLAWVQEHRDEVLGKAAPATIVPPGDAGVAYKLVPCGTCKKELPTYLAAWRRGSTVRWVLAAGAGADSALPALLREQDDAVR